MLHHGSYDQKKGGRGFKIKELVAFHNTANCVFHWDALRYFFLKCFSPQHPACSRPFLNSVSHTEFSPFLFSFWRVILQTNRKTDRVLFPTVRLMFSFPILELGGNYININYTALTIKHYHFSPVTLGSAVALTQFPMWWFQNSNQCTPCCHFPSHLALSISRPASKCNLLNMDGGSTLLFNYLALICIIYWVGGRN